MQLEKQYKKALFDINVKIRILQSDELTQSKIYQLQYQKVLKAQVEAILEKLHGDEYSTIQKYLSESYTTGFVGSVYSMHGQDVPLILPIDQNAAVKAVMTDSKVKEGLYQALGVDVNKLKKSISAEITRGIASGLSLYDISRNISNATKAPYSRAKTIVRTEAHRIQEASTFDAAKEARTRGVVFLKQWDATMDGDTRPTHRKLDGQIRELNDPFEEDGKKAMYPGGFGDPAEDCNCRCTMLTRPRAALNERELQRLKDRAEFFGLDKTKDFEDFKKKYIKAAEKVDAPLEKAGKSAIIDGEKEYVISGKRISNDLQEQSKQINEILSAYTSRESKWSKKTVVVERGKMPGVIGRKEWSCNITLRSDASVKTTIHEHLHARSISYYTPAVYHMWEFVEEGAVELFAQAICEKNGIKFSGAYTDHVKQLRIIHSILKEHNDEFDFARELFDVDLPDRYLWLRNKADGLISRGILSNKTVDALNRAVSHFSGKV